MGHERVVSHRLDESVQYILPLLPLLKVAHAVPTTKAELRRLLEPMSVTVEQRLDHLFAIVEKCRTSPQTDKNL